MGLLEMNLGLVLHRRGNGHPPDTRAEFLIGSHLEPEPVGIEGERLVDIVTPESDVIMMNRDIFAMDDQIRSGGSPLVTVNPVSGRSPAA